MGVLDSSYIRTVVVKSPGGKIIFLLFKWHPKVHLHIRVGVPWMAFILTECPTKIFSNRSQGGTEEDEEKFYILEIWLVGPLFRGGDLFDKIQLFKVFWLFSYVMVIRHEVFTLLNGQFAKLGLHPAKSLFNWDYNGEIPANWFLVISWAGSMLEWSSLHCWASF